MQLWRLVKTRHVANAFDGEGARLYGGRWNSRGTRMAYASGNSALAVLEVLVHLTGAGGLLPGYSLVAASVPDTLVESLPPTTLPPDWNTFPVPTSTQLLGDQWVASGRSLGLRVPSALVEAGFNILINPAHPQFSELLVKSASVFEFDPRFVGSSGGANAY